MLGHRVSLLSVARVLAKGLGMLKFEGRADKTRKESDKVTK